MFIPTTKIELKKIGWQDLDIILVSGDVYIDSPYDGSAIIGKVLIDKGYKVGIISQPDVNSAIDITRLGKPKLFWGVSAGCVDSMVANYTALKKKKRSDDLTPGGINNKRPDRAVIVYTNLIKQYFKNNPPILIGGIEASLRRIAHYDYWSDKLRKSILFDAKADFLIYGMAEKTIIEFADALKNKNDVKNIRGLCYISKDKKEDYIDLPSFNDVVSDKYKFIDMFHTFYQNNDPLNAQGLQQLHDTRYLIQNPPNYYLNAEELDKIYNLDFERDVHPYYKKDGKVKALETIQFSINLHRGCFGECNFCAIAVHQGRTIRSRDKESIFKEVESFKKHKSFKGIISDFGGPTANMYNMSCKKQLKSGSCKDKRCSYPRICNAMNINHSELQKLMKEVRQIDGIKKVFIGSGLRYDLVLEDKKSGERYLKDLVKYHVSGQLKVAPEHISDKVLQKMAKASRSDLLDFREKFIKYSKEAGKKQFLTYYFIAAHPACEMQDMYELKKFVDKELKLHPEQVQVFTPTPSTYSTLMYYTGIDPFSKKKMFIEKNQKEKEKQKYMIVKKNVKKKR